MSIPFHLQGLRRGRLAVMLGAASAVLCLAATIAPAPAVAMRTHLFEEAFGSAAQPQFGQDVVGLSVDQANGDVLVIQARHESTIPSISRFEPNGEPAPFSALGTNVIDGRAGSGGKSCGEEPASCDETPQGSLEFSPFPGEQQVAVDSAGGTTNGDIYVTQMAAQGGMADLVDVFGPDGRYLGQITGAGGSSFEPSEHHPCGVAVGAGGALFVSAFTNTHQYNHETGQLIVKSQLYKFTQPGTPHNPLQDSDNSATIISSEEHLVCDLAAGTKASTGSLFAVENGKVAHVLSFGEDTGALQSTFAPGDERLIAVDPTSGDVYVAGTEGGTSAGGVKQYAGETLVSEIPSATMTGGIAVVPSTGGLYLASSGRNSIVVLGPTVTLPDVSTGAASITGLTSAEVKGVVNAEGQALEECFFEYGPTTAYGQKAACEAPDAAEVGAGQGAVSVHADLGGLQKETFYHYRLVADNANAALYPHASNAIVKGQDGTFQTPGKPALKAQWAQDVSTGEATLQATINPENAETSYYLEWGPTSAYGSASSERVVAAGMDAQDHTVTVDVSGLQSGSIYHYRFVAKNAIGQTEGEDHNFTTFRLSGPPTSCPLNEAFRTGFSALLPDCRAFEMVSPVDKEGGEIRVQPDPFSGLPATVDQSAASGDAFTYGSYRAFGGAEAAPYTAQYVARRSAAGWSSEAIAPPQTTEIDSELNKFAAEYRLFDEELCDGWLRTFNEPVLAPGGVGGFPNIYRRSLCPAAGGYAAVTTVEPPGVEEARYYAVELQGVSKDGQDAIYVAGGKLTAKATSTGEQQLYEQGPEGLRFLCILPGGVPATGRCSAGGPAQASENNYSKRLNGAISQDGNKVFWSDAKGAIYLRENPFGTATECRKSTAPCTIAVAGEKSQYWGAAADGSRAIFTTEVSSEEDQLYEFLTASDEKILIAGKVAGVLGISEDASRVYFVSEEDLDGEGPAQEGQENLYLREVGEGGAKIRFITALAYSDVHPPASTQIRVASAEAWLRATRVSANGQQAVFMSVAPLTGYDNHDVISGEPDEEVYLYDAEAGEGTGRLSCVSCNPTGARPHGANLGKEGSQFWVAGAIPVAENNLHESRVITDAGRRVFFDSYDALVRADSNGQEDVYEWEAPGTGSCSEASAEYVGSASGCVYLISSGQSRAASQFIEASPDGSNVFFTTLSSLVPEDPGSVDLYDARVNGGLPPRITIHPGCEGEACQAPAQPPAALTPASLLFQGPGNQLAPPIKHKTKRKHKTKKHHGRKHHGKKHKRKRRKAKRSRARRRHHGHKASRRHRSHKHSQRRAVRHRGHRVKHGGASK